MKPWVESRNISSDVRKSLALFSHKSLFRHDIPLQANSQYRNFVAWSLQLTTYVQDLANRAEARSPCLLFRRFVHSRCYRRRPSRYQLVHAWHTGWYGSRDRQRDHRELYENSRDGYVNSSLICSMMLTRVADWRQRSRCSSCTRTREQRLRTGTSSRLSRSSARGYCWCPIRGGALIDARNILRPETVESLFLAYRLTGDRKYREWGWQIFQSFNKHCRVSTGGYTGVEDVQAVPAKKLDRMETFWLGETLSTVYPTCQSKVSPDDLPRIPLPLIRWLGAYRIGSTCLQYRGLFIWSTS